MCFFLLKMVKWWHGIEIATFIVSFPSKPLLGQVMTRKATLPVIWVCHLHISQGCIYDSWFEQCHYCGCHRHQHSYFCCQKNRKSLVVGETHFHMYIHNPYIYIYYIICIMIVMLLNLFTGLTDNTPLVLLVRLPVWAAWNWQHDNIVFWIHAPFSRLRR